MATIYIPRAFGGTIVLTTSGQPLHYINVTWVTRDMYATWKARI